MRRLALVSCPLALLLAACGGGSIPSVRADADAVAVDAPDAGVDLAAGDVPEAREDPGDGDAADADATRPDVAADPGGEAWTPVACTANPDCPTAFCIETPDGKACAATCTLGESCPEGTVCVQVAATADLAYVCAFVGARTCVPCVADPDCAGDLAGLRMSCVALSNGHFCLRRCEAGTCPAGTACDAATDTCVPDGGACACTRLGEGKEGACERAGTEGTCRGRFACRDGQPTACDAAEAVAETCNDRDDDCDGDTDEGLAGAPCPLVNAYGTCTGASVCASGQVICQGSDAKPEVCNGLDENCDGRTDEGYSDLDADGIADCVDLDRDGDGVPNDVDDCPDVPDVDQLDTDKDGLGDACDPDDDADGVPDVLDDCPLVKNANQLDTDKDGLGDACDCDLDGDAVANLATGCPDCGDACDNCPAVPNPDQADANADGIGDACDPACDNDGDGLGSCNCGPFGEACDNCPGVANPDQADLDLDGIGDACDPDDDNDGVSDTVDVCPRVPDPAQLDVDGDGQGDACDCDADGDGVPNPGPGCADCGSLCDNCRGTPNPDQQDSNADGIGDACEGDWDGDHVGNPDDNCPRVPNPDQADLDLDGQGDACDCDLDGDGAPNDAEGCAPCGEACDVCPRVPDPGQADLDGDRVGDACDPDVDGDGDPDATDCAPRDPAVSHGATEACNGTDDDCDGQTDEAGATGCVDRYFDEDGDGYGVMLIQCLCAPSGLYRAGRAGDCNDKDGSVNPGATEVCGNGRDDDCDGSENDEDATGCVRYYTDLDSDGWGVGDGRCLCTSVGDLAAKQAGDCQDQDPAVSPGLPEACGDGKDNDCDGLTDEEGCQGCTPWFRDGDGDGSGVSGDARCLGAPEAPHTAATGGDCDDANAAVHPGATEVCNGVDDDCDGQTDPAGSAGCTGYYPDADGDGYGATGPATCLCAPAGTLTATVTGDCSDGDAAVHPGAVEACGNGKDDNCNGSENDENATGCVRFYTDADRDGYGVGAGRCLCAGAGDVSATRAGDCDDADATASPGQPERCKDGKDNDCDGATDEEGCQGCTTYARDADGDGWGVAGDTKCLGAPAAPYTATATGDCDDAAAAVHPTAAEACNGVDDDCDGATDEEGATGCAARYLDEDGDGYGTAQSRCLCAVSGNWRAPVSGDCNDALAAVNPGATEVCGNGRDDDCDGSENDEDASGCVRFYTDADRDGWGVGAGRCLCSGVGTYTATAAGDCNDADAAASPGLAEKCNDGKDNDCNGLTDEEGCQGCTWLHRDADQDRYGLDADRKCLGTAAYPYTALAGGDCADGDANVHPGAPEVCNGKDDNCDGATDPSGTSGCQFFYPDVDKDAYGANLSAVCYCAPTGVYTATVAGDCNDNDAQMNPVAVEVCDAKDNNCNGQVDEGVQTTFYQDYDADGYGGLATKPACSAPAGYVAQPGDCNDYNKDIHPGAPETCNDVDDDCDGLTDDGLAVKTLYKDNDGDGFAGLGAASRVKCDVPSGWTLPKDANGDGTNDWDCDDSDSTRYPGRLEDCDGKDNDCDGYVDPQCPSTCAGTWPVQVPITTHMPLRLLDTNGDGMDEVWVVDASGKLRSISPTGTLATVCPGLTFSTGYGNKFGFTVNPSLGASKYYFQQGTRLWDLDACAEVKASANDVAAFGSAGDVDGDGVLDYVGHWEINASLCFKLSSKAFATSCVASPNGKPYDGYASTADVDGDGRAEAVLVRGRTYPDASYYDGSIDVWGWNGTSVVLEKTVPAATTGFVGGHLSGVDLADWFGDGYARRTVAFGGKVFDLGTLALAATYSGGAIPNPRSRDNDRDGDLDGAPDGVQVDLNGDGAVDLIDATGTTVTATDGLTGATLPGWPISVGSFTWSVKPVAGDVDNDGRMEVFVGSIDGAVYCYRLGVGSYRFTNLVEPGEPSWVNRTMTKDPYEPNNTVATATQVVFPTKEVRAFLTKGDVDYYRVPNVCGLFVQLYSPPGQDYDLYWYGVDETKLYGSSTLGAGQVDQIARCVCCTETAPAYYTLKVVPKTPATGGSASRPYVLKVNRSP